MAFRRVLLAAVVSAALSAGFLPGIARADDATASPDVENAKHNFIGVINASNVFVRSAPREDAYPTLKLERGAKVTVIGMKFKWLKILPPEGSFAYVPKAYVNARSDGKIGRASREVIAKVGSALNQLKTSPMGKIDDGQDVEIIGEQDEYWKIKPPTGSFVYVNETYVDPLKALPTIAEQKAAAPAVAAAAATKAPPADAKPAAPVPANEGVAVIPAAVTADVPPTPAVPAAPPAPDVAALFDRLESDFKAGNEKSITDQPIETLLAGYQDLLKQQPLTPTIRKVSEVRVATLKLRAEAKAEFLAAKEAQIQAADRQKALAAERDEIKDRIRQKEVRMYTAVGTLRASSIQRGHGTLYRLTDPASGRTVAYIQTTDTSYAGLLGQFVGVKGQLSLDPALNIKLISQPTAVEPVDPTKLNTSVTAQVTPPSLLTQHASNSPTD